MFKTQSVHSYFDILAETRDLISSSVERFFNPVKEQPSPPARTPKNKRGPYKSYTTDLKRDAIRLIEQG